MSDERPVVGLLLNYRDAPRSLRCIRSLLDDGVRPVLVWDNSEDAGVSARSLRQETADAPVTVVESGVNLGFAIGVNRALERIDAEIAISRRHIRRDPWDDVLHTLVHEMVHQWQDENGLPLDHGPHFRRKAREVGISARATRPVTSSGH